MKLYHGTTRQDAQTIINMNNSNSDNLVDVTKGGGELGLGFYLGDSRNLAIRWAKGRYNKNGAVIEFNISNSNFAKLNIKVLTHYQVSYIFDQLTSRYEKYSYLFEVDVVYGPFANQSLKYANQYKFETIAAQKLLNNSEAKIIY